MEYLKAGDLQQRAKEVFNNLLLLDKESKIGLHPIRTETDEWMILWTHVLEEFVIRFGPYPAGFTSGFMKQARIPDPTSPLAPRAANAVKATSLPRGEHLFRYGKSKYLKQVLKERIVRISPASSYDDPSLNPALRDKELELSIHPLSSGWKMKAHDAKTGEHNGGIQPKDSVHTALSETDYYVYCLSLSFAPRLFLDFDADACLVIRKPNDFEKMVLSILEDKLQGWKGGGKGVVYIDPLNCPTADIDVFYSKHFRYAYQREYRLTWRPPSPRQALDHVLIDVPDIEEYCYLLDLP